MVIIPVKDECVLHCHFFNSLLGPKGAGSRRLESILNQAYVLYVIVHKTPSEVFLLVAKIVLYVVNRKINHSPHQIGINSLTQRTRNSSLVVFSALFCSSEMVLDNI